MHLSARASIKVAPDELVARLAAIAVAPTAAAAQHRVNEMMAEARTTAAGARGARTSFRGYAVLYSEKKPPHWTAQQTLEVQALGLALGGLGWEISAERAEQTRQDATLKALARLRKQATEGARAPGMEGRPLPVGQPQQRAWRDAHGAHRDGRGRAMIAPMPPPNATPESQDVIAFVSAEVVLTMPAPAP